MIRRPIKRATALGLGLLSIAVMLVGYTLLSQSQPTESQNRRVDPRILQAPYLQHGGSQGRIP